MDRRSVLVKLEKALAALGDIKADILFENDDVVKIEIVSNIFKDVVLTNWFRSRPTGRV